MTLVEHELENQFVEPEVEQTKNLLIEAEPAPTLDQAIEQAAGEILVRLPAEKAELPDDIVLGLYHKKEDKFDDPVYAIREKDYLELTRDYLDEAVELLASQDTEKTVAGTRGTRVKTSGEFKDDVKEFREKLVYIGNAEFEHSTDRMADHILQQAESGLIVGVYEYDQASARYITTKVLTKVIRSLDSLSNYDQEEAQKIRANILYGKSPDELVERATRIARPDQHMVLVVPDDFVISGVKMSGAVRGAKAARSRLEAENNKRYLNPTKEFIPVDDAYGLVMVRSNNPRRTEGIRIESIYEADEAKASVGDLVLGGVAAAGSWSTTDYGYTVFLEEIASRIDLPHPLDIFKEGYMGGLYHRGHEVKGRYYYDQIDRDQYVDPQLNDEYQKVLEEFGLTEAEKYKKYDTDQIF